MGDFLINSIYCATEGEGIHIGTPRIFIRFQGCENYCLNCDSKGTWDFADSKIGRTSMDEILKQITEHGLQGKIKQVSITGGDPLHQKHLENVRTLVKALKELNFFINIESPGLKIDDEVFNGVDFISFDFKTPSSGVVPDTSKIYEMHQKYLGKFQMKSVIETENDFKSTLNLYHEILDRVGKIDFNWCLTPSYNLKEEFPAKRFTDVLNWNQEAGGPFRVIGQQHKWIFGPDRNFV